MPAAVRLCPSPQRSSTIHPAEKNMGSSALLATQTYQTPQLQLQYNQRCPPTQEHGLERLDVWLSTAMHNAGQPPSTTAENTKQMAPQQCPPENMGSSALMVWVKDTATEPKLMLVSVLPSVCTAARGEMDTACREGGRNGQSVAGSVWRETGSTNCHPVSRMCVCQPAGSNLTDKYKPLLLTFSMKLPSGRLCRRSSHMTQHQSEPMANWRAVMVRG